MIETFVESIRVSLVTQNHVVILKEQDGNRHLPIWIGVYEAQAIAMELQGVSAIRPLPYDLMRAMLEQLGATLDRVVVSALTDGVYFATITISLGDTTFNLDSRASDAIALAIRMHGSIAVDETVMQNAGIAIAPDVDDTTFTTSIFEEADAAASSDVTSEQVPADSTGPGDLGIFRDFINSLDLEDFDKGTNDKS